jgi:ABC-type glycerol-3-phosphate transport system permease component
VSRALGTLAVAGFVAFALAPVAFLVLASLTPEARLFETGWPALSPRGFVLEHWSALVASGALAGPIAMSLVVSSATTAACLAVGAPAAYALARLPLRGRSAVLAVVLAVSMFPQIAIISPLFLFLRDLGLVDTRLGLVLPYTTFALPLCVWLLTGYMRKLPRELEEAALVDGAGRARAFVEVVLPLAWPGVAAAAIVTFVACWNELLFALCFTTRPETRTLPVAVALLRGAHQVPWGQVLAASVLAGAPPAALVLAFQRRIASGLVAGAVKE